MSATSEVLSSTSTSAPITPPEPPIEEKTKSRMNRDHHELAQWGNYHNYYSHRALSSTGLDPRLVLLSTPRSTSAEYLFTQKSVLDLGCNAGKLTMECVSNFGARRAVGIDIDGILIDRARSILAESISSQSQIEGAKKPVDGQVEFIAADFMKPGYFSTDSTFQSTLHTSGAFDTILLLSITKWLHLHSLDSGLNALFRSLFALLPSTGTLVIEPQEWANYKAAVKKNKNLKEGFKKLEMRPPFKEELEAVGFMKEDVIERSEGGFSRALWVWRKA